MRRIKVFFIFIIILSLFVLSGCEDNTENLLNNKIASEMNYLEDIIFMIVKKYMANDYLDDVGVLDWTSIKEDFTNINNSSNTLINDFVSKNFSNDDILRFEELLNSVNLSISEQNEINLLVTLANFYSIIPEYTERYLGYNAEVTVRNIKKTNLYSIISCMQGDYNNAENLCFQAESEYVRLTKNTEYLKNNAYYVNRIYVVLQEYKISLSAKNLDLSIIKYLNTIGI